MPAGKKLPTLEQNSTQVVTPFASKRLVAAATKGPLTSPFGIEYICGTIIPNQSTHTWNLPPAVSVCSKEVVKVRDEFDACAEPFCTDSVSSGIVGAWLRGDADFAFWD